MSASLPVKEGLEFDSIKDSDAPHVILMKCADCRHEMNRTRVMTGKEISANWLMIAMGSPLNAGKCPNGCRSTFSDCNMNTDLVIEAATDDRTKA